MKSPTTSQHSLQSPHQNFSQEQPRIPESLDNIGLTAVLPHPQPQIFPSRMPRSPTVITSPYIDPLQQLTIPVQPVLLAGLQPPAVLSSIQVFQL